MRTKSKKPPCGTHRTIEKFLWWPLTITTRMENSTTVIETRWLETAKIEQVYTESDHGHFWRDWRFLDK